MKPPYRPGGQHLLAQQHALLADLTAWLTAQGAPLATWDYGGTDAWTVGYYLLPSAFALHTGLVQMRYVPCAVVGTAREVWGPARRREHDARLWQALVTAEALMAPAWRVELKPVPWTVARFCPVLYVEGASNG